VYYSFLFIFYAILFLKGLMDANSQTNSDKKIDSLRVSSDMQLASIRHLQNTADEIRKALKKKGLFYDSLSGKIVSKNGIDEEALKINRLQHSLDSSKSVEQAIKEKEMLQNQIRINSLPRWNYTLRAIKDTVYKDSAKLEYIKDFHWDKFRWPADKAQQIYDANTKLDKDKNIMRQYLDSINNFKQ
jgi:hypothetical protein